MVKTPWFPVKIFPKINPMNQIIWLVVGNMIQSDEIIFFKMVKTTNWSLYQWPFQEPKLEVPNIYKAYFLGLNFREYPQKI